MPERNDLILRSVLTRRWCGSRRYASIDAILTVLVDQAMAPLVATSKPFSPTVHVLILPTRLPLDMRHAFRNLDEIALVSPVEADP